VDGDPAERIDRGKPGVALLPLAQIDRDKLAIEPKFLEREGDLLRIG